MKIFRALAALTATLSCPYFVSAADESDTIEPGHSKVNVLTYNNFDRFIGSHELVLMEFYAPWCGHCQQLAPHYRAAAAELTTMDLPRPISLAKYDDGDEYNRQLRAGAPDMYNYTSYPSLFIFDKGEHSRYLGGRSAEDIIFWMSTVSKGLDPIEEELKTKPGLYKDDPEFSKHVIDFDDEFSSFTDQIVASGENKLRVVEFYSDRCPFCQSLAKEFVEAAKQLKAKYPSKVEVHAVNTRIFHEVSEDWEITGHPWVCFFYNGEKVEDMAGLGGADSIINWASKKIEDHWEDRNEFHSGKAKVLAEQPLVGEDENEEGSCSTEGPGDGDCGDEGEESEEQKKLRDVILEMEVVLEKAKKLLA